MKEKKIIITIIIVVVLTIISIIAIMIGMLFPKKENEIKNNFSLSYTRHTVLKNDTLETIAKKYNLFEEEILKVNELKSEKEIKEGMKLLIPNVVLYPVSEGVTLDSLSEMFNMTKYQIKIANDLTDDDISKKVLILIPNRVVHVAEKDEKMADVAKKYNLKMKDLNKYFGKEIKEIKKGEYFVVPIKTGTKKINGVEMTREEYESFKALNALATALYENGDYKNFSYSDEGHYMIVDAARDEKEDIEDYLLNCVITDPIITFDFSDKIGFDGKHKFGLRYDCRKEFR